MEALRPGKGLGKTFSPDSSSQILSQRLERSEETSEPMCGVGDGGCLAGYGLSAILVASK